MLITKSFSGDIGNFENQFNNAQLQQLQVVAPDGTHFTVYSKSFGSEGTVGGIATAVWESTSCVDPPQCLGVRDDLGGRALRGPLMQGKECSRLKCSWLLFDSLEFSFQRGKTINVHVSIDYSMFLNVQLAGEMCSGKACMLSFLNCNWMPPFPPCDLADNFKFDADNWVYSNHTFDKLISSACVDVLISRGSFLELIIEFVDGEFIQYLGAEVQLDIT